MGKKLEITETSLKSFIALLFMCHTLWIKKKKKNERGTFLKMRIETDDVYGPLYFEDHNSHDSIRFDPRVIH